MISKNPIQNSGFRRVEREASLPTKHERDTSVPTQAESEQDAAAQFRAQLRGSTLVSDLREFFEGSGRTLTPLQVRVGLAFLDKAYPTVKAVEIDAKVTHATTRREIEEKLAALGVPIDGVWERIE